MTSNSNEVPKEPIEPDLIALLEKNTFDVPYFYEDGVSESFFIPVKSGEIRVFHHKPKSPITKRPILFIPGFGTSLWAWKDFSFPFVERGEFYFLETREKKSSRFKNRFKANMSITQVAKDIDLVIHHLGLNKQDYVLLGTSYCAGAILKGLIEKILTAKTIVLIDPFFKLLYYRKLISVLRFVPPSILNLIRYILGRIALKGENNETQRNRAQFIRDEAVMWKWRRACVSVLKTNLLSDLHKISEEVLVFFGPQDKHHPPNVYLKVAERIPNSRYFAAISPEDKRELTCAVIGLEFCKIQQQDGVPDSLKFLEKSVVKLNKPNLS